MHLKKNNNVVIEKVRMRPEMITLSFCLRETQALEYTRICTFEETKYTLL